MILSQSCQYKKSNEIQFEGRLAMITDQLEFFTAQVRVWFNHFLKVLRCFISDRSSPTEALTRPRPLTPSSIESPSCEHAYQVTDDLVTEKQTVGKELKDKAVFWAL